MGRHRGFGTSRRRFLRGAGACVGLPWLASLPGAAYADDGFPLRFVVFTHGQGTLLDEMVQPGGTETAWDFGEVLSSLAPRQSDVVLIEGIDDATHLLDTPYNGHTRCRVQRRLPESWLTIGMCDCLEGGQHDEEV